MWDHIVLVFLFLAYVTQRNILWVHPSCCKWETLHCHGWMSLPMCVYTLTHRLHTHTHTAIHMCHIFFIHSSIVEYVGSCHTLAVVNDATVNICCCSVTKLCLTLCNLMDCSMPGFPVLHYFPEFAQTHVHWVDDVIQPSHPLLLPSPPILNLSQHQGLFQWWALQIGWPTDSALQLQHQSFQWIFRVDFL